MQHRVKKLFSNHEFGENLVTHREKIICVLIYIFTRMARFIPSSCNSFKLKIEYKKTHFKIFRKTLVTFSLCINKNNTQKHFCKCFRRCSENMLHFDRSNCEWIEICFKYK